MSIPTHHIEAKNMTDFAKTVLMPGDPLRAKYIAENYLENPVLVNGTRGALAYTGMYDGKKVSVMASGMGNPSIGIYSYELYNFYNVNTIIRIGSAGAISDDVKIRDVVIGMGVCTDSNYISQFELPGVFAPVADFETLLKAVKAAGKLGIAAKVGNILSSDLFYDESENLKKWKKMGVLAVEMESAALYSNAARCGKKALCICTISDTPLRNETPCTPEEREKTFNDMIRIGLEIADE